MTDSLIYRVKTKKRHIAYINFIIEAMDGMAVVRTADPEDGLLEILVSPDFEADFLKLAGALSGEMEFRVITPAGG